MTFKFTSMLPVALLVAALMSSCSKNDDPVSVKDVMGNYTGQMEALPLPTAQAEQERKDIYAATAFVKADSILSEISALPKSVFKSIGKDVAPPITAVSLRMAYSPVLNKTNDSISLKLDPKPIVSYLEFDEIVGADTLVIKLKPTQLGSYAVGSKKMKMEFIVDEVTINGKPSEKEVGTTMAFDFVKK